MFSFWTDHYGYFNSLNTNRFVGAYEYPTNKIPYGALLYSECTRAHVKDPVDGLAKNGILKEIENPNGGVLTYAYEQNTAFYNGQNIPYGGVRVKTLSQFDGVDHNKDILKEYRYVQSDGASSSGWGYEEPKYSLVRNKTVFKQSSNRRSMSGFEDFAIGAVTDFSKWRNGGFANIRGSNGANFLAKQKTDGALLALSIIVNVLFDIFTNDRNDTYQTEYSNFPYQAGNFLPFQYSRVEVLDKVQNIYPNGKMVEEFTSPEHTPIAIPVLNFPFSNKDRYIKWAYGLPKRQLVINSAGKILRETINNYNVIANVVSNDVNFQSKNWEANTFIFDAYPSSHTAYIADYGNVTEESYLSTNRTYRIIINDKQNLQ
jgi:hypothetical protein